MDVATMTDHVRVTSRLLAILIKISARIQYRPMAREADATMLNPF